MVGHENVTGDYEDISGDHEIITGNLKGGHETNVSILFAVNFLVLL
jgi:hypothetical protein